MVIIWGFTVQFSQLLCIFLNLHNVGGKSGLAFCLPSLVFCFIINFYCILQKYWKGINQKGNLKIFNKIRKQCLKTYGMPQKQFSKGSLWEKKVLVAQSCPILCDPMDCSPPGSSVHGIFQARILDWVAISFSSGSSQPRDWTQVSCTAGRFFTDWAMREAQEGSL